MLTALPVQYSSLAYSPRQWARIICIASLLQLQCSQRAPGPQPATPAHSTAPYI